MSRWREIRSGRQFVNLDYLDGKPLVDELETVQPGQYQGKPQIIGLLKKLQMNVAINTTSCELMEKKYGDDIDGWKGRKVKISKGKAKFGRSFVDAIIVEPSK